MEYLRTVTIESKYRHCEETDARSSLTRLHGLILISGQFPAYFGLSEIGGTNSGRGPCHPQEDLAGGKLPSGSFGENSAWRQIMAFAHNLNTAMKKLALRISWVAKRMKAIRFSLINLPGRIIEHAATGNQNREGCPPFFLPSLLRPDRGS
ncbi:hypothetical protein [Syntrophorhabdus aromaticivorans]|uniref:Transposase DDE domain-containing protein n=1 Tax=Syntrophorhabdus aromaticivorans TaxID=328301 RepID=A0A971M734_9BACT|nr:hypothetical protein [Syntrophorhabdus aromaticivorans]NLW36396.1 hypothetical protein [Syntrophorhabdus aromaticivorans]